MADTERADQRQQFSCHPYEERTSNLEPAEHPNLNLSPEERRYFGQLFTAADTDKIGVVTGEVAVKFFEKTKLPPATLGEVWRTRRQRRRPKMFANGHEQIWQIADTENRGLLTPAGFGIVLRLIGYAQAGKPVSSQQALKSGGPLPKFDGIPLPAVPQGNAGPQPLQPQNSGPIRVPPLSQDKVTQFSSLFDESGAQNGTLSGASPTSDGTESAADVRTFRRYRQTNLRACTAAK